MDKFLDFFNESETFSKEQIKQELKDAILQYVSEEEIGKFDNRYFEKYGYFLNNIENDLDNKKDTKEVKEFMRHLSNIWETKLKKAYEEFKNELDNINVK